MMNRSRLGRRVAMAMVIALTFASSSCTDAPTAPASPSNGTPPSDLLGLPIFGSPPRLLWCPSSETQTAQPLLIGESGGGTLSLGGTSVTIPLGALSAGSEVELSIPAGQYMEVDLSVNGGSFIFPQPVVVTIDYSRCNRFATLFRLLSVWNIDENTKALLENMGGIDNKLAQSITFTTLHFSGFAIAY